MVLNLPESNKQTDVTLQSEGEQSPSLISRKNGGKLLWMKQWFGSRLIRIITKLSQTCFPGANTASYPGFPYLWSGHTLAGHLEIAGWFPTVEWVLMGWGVLRAEQSSPPAEHLSSKSSLASPPTGDLRVVRNQFSWLFTLGWAHLVEGTLNKRTRPGRRSRVV